MTEYGHAIEVLSELADKLDALPASDLSAEAVRRIRTLANRISCSLIRRRNCVQAPDDLQALDREIQAAADLIGHKDWRLARTYQETT